MKSRLRAAAKQTIREVEDLLGELSATFAAE
jgi:hypothetical protein